MSAQSDVDKVLSGAVCYAVTYDDKQGERRRIVQTYHEKVYAQAYARKLRRIKRAVRVELLTAKLLLTTRRSVD